MCLTIRITPSAINFMKSLRKLCEIFACCSRTASWNLIVEALSVFLQATGICILFGLGRKWVNTPKQLGETSHYNLGTIVQTRRGLVNNIGHMAMNGVWLCTKNWFRVVRLTDVSRCISWNGFQTNGFTHTISCLNFPTVLGGRCCPFMLKLRVCCFKSLPDSVKCMHLITGSCH